MRLGRVFEVCYMLIVLKFFFFGSVCVSWLMVV